MDPTRKSQLHQLALGQAMQAAARDYGKVRAGGAVAAPASLSTP